MKNPNSSLIWVQFASFAMETEGIEKARLILERSLRVVNFRQETDKLNIWNAYMNLENSFGSEANLIK